MAKLPIELAPLANKRATELTAEENEELRLARRRQAHKRVSFQSRGEVVERAIVMLRIREGVPLTCSLLTLIGNSVYHIGKRENLLVGRARVRDILRGCGLHPQGKFSMADTINVDFRISDETINATIEHYRLDPNAINTTIGNLLAHSNNNDHLYEKSPVAKKELDYEKLKLKT